MQLVQLAKLKQTEAQLSFYWDSFMTQSKNNCNKIPQFLSQFLKLL
jgi:hypothetical protein